MKNTQIRTDDEMRKIAVAFIRNMETATEVLNIEEHEKSDEFRTEVVEVRRIVRRRYVIRKRVIPIVAVIVIGLLMVAFWRPVSRFVVELFDKYSSTQHGQMNEPYKEVSFAYIPEGFELVQTEEIQNMKMLIYASGDSILTIEVKKIGTDAGIDTEDADYETIYIQGRQAFISTKDGRVILVIEMYGNEITIIGEVLKEDVIKIVEEVK